MGRGQISVSKSGLMTEVLEEAKRVFNDADSEGDVIRRLAIDWHRNREKNSKRGALERIEKNEAYTRAVMSQVEARLAAIEMNLKDALRLTEKK